MRKICLLLFLGLHILILSKLQFVAWPEMVSFPYLLNHGFVNYKDMVHAYPPLVVSILSIFYKAFGYNLWVLKFYAWASFLTSDLLVFGIVKKLAKKVNLALFAVVVYAVLQTVLDGNMVWPDLAMIPFLLGGFLCLINKKYILSGVSFGLALLTKQTAGFYILCSMVYVVTTNERFKNLVQFIIGGLAVGLPFLVLLIWYGALKDFINWAVIYPSQYWTKFPGYVQLLLSNRDKVILIILIVPFFLLLAKTLRTIKMRRNNYLLWGFLICGIVGVYPRFSFFHLQPLIPFLVISYFYLAANLSKRFLYIVFLAVIFVVTLNLSKLNFGGDRFWSENMVLGQKIQAETMSDKTIYLLGLSSDVYVFSERFPNKPWLDNFGWYLEIPGVQEKVVESFETNPPIIFWQTSQNGQPNGEVKNWYDIGAYQPKMITDWIRQNYVYKKDIVKGIGEWVKKQE